MSKAKFRAVQKTGTYQNAEGDNKNSYIELGVVFENEKGHLSMKLHALPLPNETGEVWMNLFPIDSAKPEPKQVKKPRSRK